MVPFTQTSIFGNWKPDYLMAAPYFERAANVYKGTGADDQAKVMWLKAAECQVRDLLVWWWSWWGGEGNSSWDIDSCSGYGR